MSSEHQAHLCPLGLWVALLVLWFVNLSEVRVICEPGGKQLQGNNRIVIHVTESYGGGVASAIRDYCRNYPEAKHHLIYAARADAPLDRSLMRDFTEVIEMGPGHFSRITRIREHIQQYPQATIHAHSSFGGAYARLAIRKSARRPIVYTPHCYGFERRDVSALRRGTFWLAEWMLAFNTTTFAACSKREQALSKWPLAGSRSVLLNNVPAGDIQASTSPVIRSKELKVVGAGRLSAQKDPGYFLDCIEFLRGNGYAVDPVWIGGGDPEMEAMLHEADIPTTGWLSRDETLKCMSEMDVYIHTAQWEGFPIAVLEAALAGVAIVVRDIPAFEGVEMPLRIDVPDELLNFWSQLYDLEFRNSVNDAVRDALSNCNDQQQSETLDRVYAMTT